jgi:sugar O-acyltransferase (sialic acid O-acetyltransferase NeuD family)
MKNNKILLIGGGGHCRSVLDSLLESKQYSEIGIIDKKENIGQETMGVRYIGTDDNLQDLFQNGFSSAFVSLGSIGDPSVRIRLYKKIMETGFSIPVIYDVTAAISKNAVISEGVYIGKNAVVNAGTSIGSGAIINTGAIIEHDCQIGEFVHIASGAVLGGNVTIKDHTHIGSGSVIKQGITVGKNSIIGMGSVVLKNTGNHITAYGNPCREV